MREVAVIGAAMVPFGKFPDKTVADIAWPAAKHAIEDAGVPKKDIEAAYCGTALGGMMAGQRVLKQLGITGLPIVNVENACSSSSSAFREAWIAVAAGVYDVALVIGVMFITAEYRTGLIRTTFTASPRRGRVLAAKAIVLGAVTFTATLIAVAITIPVGDHLLRENGNPIFPLPALTLVRVEAGTAALLAVAAVLALAVGALLRRSAWLAGTSHPATVAGGAGTATARAGSATEDNVFSFAGKTLDFDTLELHSGGNNFQLTLMEAKLLRHLIRNAGRTVSRKSILEDVWGLHQDTDTRAIDNFVVRLRRYLEDDPSEPRHLLTVRGVGYRFVA